jgi:hypothetical protein
MLCSVDWQLVIDVSGKRNDPIFKGQAVREELARSACTGLALKGTVIRSVVKARL